MILTGALCYNIFFIFFSFLVATTPHNSVCILHVGSQEKISKEKKTDLSNRRPEIFSSCGITISLVGIISCSGVFPLHIDSGACEIPREN